MEGHFIYDNYEFNLQKNAKSGVIGQFCNSFQVYVSINQ